ncbi:MAG: class I SAM-dependent methyltransferase [Actinobacteria bacterium]|nr:class I SAM-dependent methyltransferase [Actinomycetota bacterium]
MTSLSFERAADYYDATRALPADVSEQVSDLLVAELSGRPACLEIGVGTGRIALPLHQRGIDLVGIDLARPMLDRLVAKTGGRAPFPLLVGDATRLPLAEGSCGAVFACHVLHLVPNWRTAVDEALRVLRPGGVLLVDFGGPVRAPWHEATTAIAATHGVSQLRPGASDPDEVAAYLGTRAGCRALSPVRFDVTITLGGELDNWRRQIHSWTWDYSAETMRAFCDDVQRWAVEEGRELDQPATLADHIRWLAYEPA